MIGMLATLPAVSRALGGMTARGSDPEIVAPGMGAFLVFFALAIVLVFLSWSLTRRVRRSEHRNAMRAAAEEEAAQAGQPEQASPGDQTPPEDQTRPEDQSSPEDQTPPSGMPPVAGRRPEEG